MQVLVVGMSAALAGPSLWSMIDHPDTSARFKVTVEHIEGPFEAVVVDGGLTTGGLLAAARPGMHIAWVLQLSTPVATDLDLDTRLMRQRDEMVAAWSHRQLGKVGPEAHLYLLDQALPADLKPGRYQIVQDVSLHESPGSHRQLPSIALDVLAATGS